MAKKAKKASTKKAKKAGEGEKLKFGSPEWRAKYGAGKKKSKKSKK